MNEGEQTEEHTVPSRMLMISSTLIDDGPPPEFPSDIPFYPFHYSKNQEDRSASPKKDEARRIDDEANELELFSAKKLKAMLKENMSKSQSVHQIKAKLRKEFIKEITKQSNKQQSTPHKSDTGEGYGARGLLSLERRIVLSLLYSFLQRHHLYHTISVFLAESGLEDKTRSVVSEYDVSQLLLHHVALPADLAIGLKKHFPNATLALHPTSKHNKTHAEDEEEGKEGKEPESLLEVFLHYFLQPSQNRDHRKEIAIQTDDVHGSEGIREMLLKQLQEISNSAEQKKYDVSQLTHKTMEEKYLLYQKECQLHYQREYELSLKYYQENDRLKIKAEESERANKATEQMRSQFEAEYQQRFQHYLEREQAFQRQIQQQEEKFQQNAYEQRQSFQHQLQSLQQQEIALKRKYELEKEGLMTLEHHLKQFENKLLTKEKELDLKDRQYSSQSLELREQLRRELQKDLHLQYESFKEEQMRFIQERKTVHEEQLRWREKLDDFQLMSDQLKQTKQSLLLAEDRLVQLEHENRMLQSKGALEEKAISEMMTSVSPDLLSFTGINRVLELIKINRELKTTLETYQDAKALKEQLDSTQQELHELKLKYKEQTQVTSIEKSELSKERDRLKEDYGHMQAKLKAYEYQLLELRQLLSDKEKNVRILERERLVQQHQLRTSRPSSSGVTNTYNGDRTRRRSNSPSSHDYPPSYYNSYPRETAERPFTNTNNIRHVSFVPTQPVAANVPNPTYLPTAFDKVAVSGEDMSLESKFRQDEYNKLREQREQAAVMEAEERKKRQDAQFQQQLALLEAEKKRLQDRESLMEKEKQLEVLRLQQEYQLKQLEKEKEILRQHQLYQFQQPLQPNFYQPLPAPLVQQLAPPTATVISQPKEQSPTTVVANTPNSDPNPLPSMSRTESVPQTSPKSASPIKPTQTFSPAAHDSSSLTSKAFEEEEMRNREREMEKKREYEEAQRREREQLEREREEEDRRRRRAKEEEDERLERERREAAEELARERQRLKDREQEKERQRQAELDAERERRLEQEREADRERERKRQAEDEARRKEKEREEAQSALERAKQNDLEAARKKELEEIEAARAKVLARRAQQRKSLQMTLTSSIEQPSATQRLQESDDDEEEKSTVPAPRAMESPLSFQNTAKPIATALPVTRNTVSSSAMLLMRSSGGNRPRFEFSDDEESEDRIEVGDEDESGLGAKW